MNRDPKAFLPETEDEMTEGELEALNGGLLIQEEQHPDIIIPCDEIIEFITYM